MDGLMDEVMDMLARLRIEEDVIYRRATYDERLGRMLNLVVLKWPDLGVVTSTQYDEPDDCDDCDEGNDGEEEDLFLIEHSPPTVTSTRYPVKRKRDAKPKPWPGFDLR